VAELARRMVCPACRGELGWVPDEARCAGCRRTYRRQRTFWDFVPED
jgi:hypothetical protein